MDNRKIVLLTAGTLGDVFPFIALAKELKKLGYEPILATWGLYRKTIEAEDIAVVEIRPGLADLMRDHGIDLPEITRRQRSVSDGISLIRKLFLPYWRSTYSSLLAAFEDAALVINHSTVFWGEFAAEQRGVPYVRLILTPLSFMSAYDPPQGRRLPFVRSPASSWARNYNRALLWLLWQLCAFSLGRPRQFRREAGLPEKQQTSAALAIGLYSPLMGDVQPHFPPRSTVAGFSFYDGDMGGHRQLDPELHKFLNVGAAPIVFTLGSILAHEDFYRHSIEAAQRLKRRALLVATDDLCERLRDKAADDVCVRAYAPHSLVLPHASVVVHHGGIGTTGQALRAGKPQIIVPFCNDQPDNAGRVSRLGVGRVIGHKNYTAARAATELAAVLDDPKYALKAIEVAKVVANEDGASAAAQLIHAYLLAGGRANEKAVRRTA